MSTYAKRAIYTDRAPEPAGPYSQAIVADSLLFISGQTPRDLRGVRHADASLTHQAELVMTNLQNIASAAGASLDDAVKVTVYVRPEVDIRVFNDVYGRYFGEIPPARTLIVSELTTGAIEVDAIVRLTRGS